MRFWILLWVLAATHGAAAADETALDQDEVHVVLRPVRDRAWSEAPPPRRVAWDEWTLFWKVRPAEELELVAPLVPANSLQISIENHGREPLILDGAALDVEDAEGHVLPIAEDAAQFLPRVVEELLARAPQLRFLAEGPSWPRGVLGAMVASVPLAGAGVTVPAGGRWSGALVFLDGGPQPGPLQIRWSGGRVGARLMSTLTATVPLGEGGRCFARSSEWAWVSGRRLGHPHYAQVPVLRLDGVRVSYAEMQRALLEGEESRAAEERARRLRIAGWTLSAAGTVGAGFTAGELSASGHDRLAPAGLALLPLAGVGALMVYLGNRAERSAVRDFNRSAVEHGACSGS